MRDGVVVTLILDGHHLAEQTVEMIRRCAGGRIALITDAISAAGRPDGEHDLGDRRVTVRNGVARLDDGTLAGSVLTMDEAVRNFVELGASVPEAIEAATVTPARLIGRPELTSMDPGTPADITILDDALAVQRTIVDGRVIWSR